MQERASAVILSGKALNSVGNIEVLPRFQATSHPFHTLQVTRFCSAVGENHTREYYLENRYYTCPNSVIPKRNPPIPKRSLAREV